MATTAKIAKEAEDAEVQGSACATAASCAAVRAPTCGSSHMCRLCFRKLALEGDVTGVTKSSW